MGLREYTVYRLSRHSLGHIGKKSNQIK